MATSIIEATVLDFVRSLGYEPGEVSEVHLSPFEVTVRGYRFAGDRVLLDEDGQPIEWSETLPVNRGDA